MGINELMKNEKALEEAYRFLAASFYLPQKTIFSESNLFRSLSASLAIACPEAVVFSKKMELNYSMYTEEALQVDYARLFVGPYELLAPPYGSVYLELGGRVMGETTIEVQKIYRSEGLAMDEDFKEMPDHIAVELEFMSFLVNEEIQALGAADLKTAETFQEKQKMFLNNYLRWIPQFCSRIKEGTDNTFYRALADCLQEFVIKTEVKNIGKIVQCNKALQKSCLSQVSEGSGVSTGD